MILVSGPKLVALVSKFVVLILALVSYSWSWQSVRKLGCGESHFNFELSSSQVNLQTIATLLFWYSAVLTAGQ